MKKHMKRLLAPKFWKIGRKEKKFAVRPRAGPHALRECIPLLVIVRDILEIVEKGREAKSVIKQRAVLVDGKVRTDHKYPVGLMDVVEIPTLGLVYRLVPTAKGLDLLSLTKAEAKKEANKKLCKVIGKTTRRGGKAQLNTHDGRNVRVIKGEAKKYKTGDSLVIELPSQKILNHLKMEKGNMVVVTRGKNAGRFAKILEIVTPKAKEPTKAICEVVSGDKERIEVLKTHMFVVGKTKPLIKLSE